MQLSQSVAMPLDPVEDPQSVMEKTGVYYRQKVSDLLRNTQATHPIYWLQLKGSGHVAFTDLIHWTPVRVGFFKVLMGEGNARVIAQAINNLTIVFFSEHLLSSSESKPKIETVIQDHSDLLETLVLSLSPAVMNP